MLRLPRAADLRCIKGCRPLSRWR